MPSRTVLTSLDPVVRISNYYRSLDATSRDKCVAKTITDIITVIHGEGHQTSCTKLHRLNGTDVSEFIHARYGSLVEILQDGTCRDDFVARYLLTLIRLC